MQEMTTEEYRSFLLDRARTATLATVRVDGDTVVFTTGETMLKARNMRRDLRVSLGVDDQEPPFHFVLIEGTAELAADDPDLLHWATRIAGRYMGEDLADSYGRRNAVEGELLVRVTPTKIVARKNIAD